MINVWLQFLKMPCNSVVSALMFIYSFRESTIILFNRWLLVIFDIVFLKDAFTMAFLSSAKKKKKPQPHHCFSVQCFDRQKMAKHLKNKSIKITLITRVEFSYSDVTIFQLIRGTQVWSISISYWPRDSQAHGGGDLWPSPPTKTLAASQNHRSMCFQTIANMSLWTWCIYRL